MNKLLLALPLAVLAGCAQTTTTTGPSDQILAFITGLSNKASADLTQAIAVANAATPPDADGAACATAGLTANTAIQQVVTASGGKGAGAFTVAEIASLYQPGSPQFQWVVKTVGSGCFNKVADVQQAGVATAQTLVGAAATLGIVLPK